jgi:16S rRNA (guanine527-N7)-methyltransferase
VDRVRQPLPTRVDETPELPTEYGAALDRGLTGLGLALPSATRDAIDGHVRLLLAWTTAINLTAVRDPVAAATSHVLDSLAAVRLLRSFGVDRFLDIGSGGGLPGIPLALALPATHALLVEPIGKKADFLRTAAAGIGARNRLEVTATRAETLARDPRQRGQWPVVTARAVASTADLVELAFPLLVRGGRLVAWKRGDLEAELAGARRAIEALGGGDLELVDPDVPGLADHRLVVATMRGGVPDAYPRDPAARRRRPW